MFAFSILCVIIKQNHFNKWVNSVNLTHKHSMLVPWTVHTAHCTCVIKFSSSPKHAHTTPQIILWFEPKIGWCKMHAYLNENGWNILLKICKTTQSERFCETIYFHYAPPYSHIHIQVHAHYRIDQIYVSILR